MVLLIGLGLLVAWFIFGTGALMQFDDSPWPWFRNLCFILVWPCLIGGVVFTLVGFGIWIAHPHTVHF
jgi:hypothetical protein